MSVKEENKIRLNASIKLARVMQGDDGPDGIRQALGVIGERHIADDIGIRSWPEKRNQRGWDFIGKAGQRVQVKSHSKGAGAPDRWIKIAPRGLLQKMTGRLPGGEQTYTDTELVNSLLEMWDVLAVAYVDEGINVNTVAVYTADQLIANDMVTQDRDGLYVWPNEDNTDLTERPHMTRFVTRGIKEGL